MQQHPFTETIVSKVAGGLVLWLALSIQWGLLVSYAGLLPIEALADSIVSIGMLATAGYLSWYVSDSVRVWQAQVVLALLVQTVCLGSSFAIFIYSGLEHPDVFIRTLPFRFLFGLLAWTILIQWYHQSQKEEAQPDEPIEKRVEPETEEFESIDRVSVKDGVRIHIIHLDELLYIQASGDYVTLFTCSGQYVKEQTMKYFEQHLPASLFVRIHRSCIVHTEQIMRVELFGKENYQVRLKNGTTLRASNTGYKLLKERLSL